MSSAYTTRDKVRDCLALALFVSIIIAVLIRDTLKSEKQWHAQQTQHPTDK